MLNSAESVAAAARRAVAETAVTDVHTHLFPPSHDGLLLWGADEILTYHYLVAELFTVAPADLTPERFWSLPKPAQADLVWEHVFVKHGALSEACRGAITTFNALGLDVAGRDLAGIRKWFAAQKADEYLARVFEMAGIDYAVMTNNPFVPAEVDCWGRDLPRPECLKTALRIDPLLVAWADSARALAEQGYDVAPDGGGRTFDEVRRFLADWTKRLGPVYFAASLGPEFAYPDESLRTQLIDRAIAPAAKDAGVPLALMMGVRKAVNPALGDGGDGVGVADCSALMGLLQQHADAKFLVTML